jgi:starch phosphorylase
MTAEQVLDLQRKGYNPWNYYHASQELRQVLDMLRDGYFSPHELGRFKPIVDTLTHGGDRFMLLADYASYIECQARVDALYQQPEHWLEKSILNVARMGKFSSDRTIREYAEEIWKVAPVKARES